MHVDWRRSLWFLPFASFCVLEAIASQDPLVDVALDPAIECWYHDGFPEISARFEPATVEHSRLYFRCSSYRDYYFVDLEPTVSGRYRGVGPVAQESCPSVLYYVEAVTSDFQSVRTPEREAEVTGLGSCRRRFPAAAVFTGDPDIVVGSVTAGVERMAPGFKTVGVKGFLSAGGEVVAGGGGGPSSSLLVGIGAVGVTGVALATGSGGGEPAVSPSAVAPSSVSSPETSGSAPPATGGGGGEALRACFATEPSDATIPAGDSIRLDARCSTGNALSYQWDLGDGRRRDGAFINPVFRDPGRFTVTLTVTQPDGASGLRSVTDTVSREITVEAPEKPLTPCFTATVLTPGNFCDMQFDAFCSDGDIVSYDWILDETNVMGAGPYPDQGVSITHDWTGYPGCTTSPPWPTISVKLTVKDPQGNAASISKAVQVQFQTASAMTHYGIASTFTSELSSRDTSEGRVRVNERNASVTPSGSPHSHAVRGVSGDNTVHASLVGPLRASGTWRFDFRSASGFVPASLAVSQGKVLAVDAYAIVFHLSGASGETVSFTYRLGE